MHKSKHRNALREKLMRMQFSLSRPLSSLATFILARRAVVLWHAFLCFNEVVVFVLEVAVLKTKAEQSR